MEIAKLQASCFFQKASAFIRVERECVHMVARLTKISITLSIYFRIAQVESSDYVSLNQATQ